jgi:hypothetical protein
MVGPSDALSTERQYVLTVLPMALLHDVMAVISSPGKRLTALSQGAALIIGFATTTFGYVYSFVHSRFRR